MRQSGAGVCCDDKHSDCSWTCRNMAFLRPRVCQDSESNLLQRDNPVVWLIRSHVRWEHSDDYIWQRHPLFLQLVLHQSPSLLLHVRHRKLDLCPLRGGRHIDAVDWTESIYGLDASECRRLSILPAPCVCHAILGTSNVLPVSSDLCAGGGRSSIFDDSQ